METWVKRRNDAPRGLFAAEAAGLTWLRVPGGVPIVKVLETTENSITLEHLTSIVPTAKTGEVFGQKLSVTHDSGAPSFGTAPEGFSGPCFIADLEMSTDPCPTWGQFFARQRILPYARMARRTLGHSGYATMEALAATLEEGHFDDGAPPARIHGDLWSGNLLFTPQGATLIDPSAHGGHRISDLAMLDLFGAPYLEGILEAYEATSIHLPPDWRNLISLHQVYPYLVHAVLFGGGYADSAVRAAQVYL
jgi:fructosamine-3-kinase